MQAIYNFKYFIVAFCIKWNGPFIYLHIESWNYCYTNFPMTYPKLYIGLSRYVSDTNVSVTP